MHALLYREVLLVWIFNAGRTGDTVERVVLGGRRGGIGGHRLDELFDAPFTLAPGRSKRVEVSVEALPAERLTAARAGWTSVWLLLGSMRQRRAELLPVPRLRPPTVGWRLAPRTAGLRRYLPALAALAVVLCGAPGLPRVVGAAMLIVLLTARLYAAMLSPGSRRVRVERWFCGVGAPLAIAAATAPDAWATQVLTGLYLFGAGLLAIPGAVETSLDQARHIRGWRPWRRGRSEA